MTRKILIAVLSLTALPALASDTSPFYRNQFVVTKREQCATRPIHESDVSPFYKNQFVAPNAESCAAMVAKDGAAAHPEENEPQHRAAALGSSDARS